MGDESVQSSSGATETLMGQASPEIAAKRGRGRPKGSKNRPKNDALVPCERLSLAESRRKVIEGSDFTALQLVERAQIKTGAKGGTNAQKAYIDRITKLEQKDRDATDKRLAEAEGYVRLAEMYIRLAPDHLRERFESKLLPHPSDVEVDFEKRTVRILGPATTLERRRWDALKLEVLEERDLVLDLRKQVEQDPGSASRQLTYTAVICRYLDIIECFPERHRPAPLPLWRERDAITWHPFELPTPTRRKLRRVVDVETES